MRATISREFRFEAAHWLPNVPEGHKCRRLHGHSYRIEVHVGGEVDSEMGWVMDFAVIDLAAAPLVRQLDHNCLNDLPGLDNPTSENLARWVWEQLELVGLERVVVRETRTSACTYEGA
jgi:6-pyruvoyltetrahydropterin/6-carboxytetrahydropterin synthase